MEPKKISHSLLKESYFYMKHPSGLDIYVYPKKGYNSKYAIFGTKFGSMDNTFKLKHQESYTVVPDGIAHYLEHKLFAGKEGDAFELFAKTGASANAYTSFSKTAYLFSCTENFEESLNILLDFVQSPYFTKENVEKERGIIAQEIKMYQDSPDWKVFINLLNALYKNHPVKIDTAGSVESISKITPEILYECYNTFYNLHNMTLCLVGDIDYEKIFSFVDKKLKYSMPLEIDRFYPIEPHEIVTDFISESFDIQSSIFNLGFKENIGTNSYISTEQSVYTDILLHYLCSPSCEMYRELLDKNLINTSSFTSEHLEGIGHSAVVFSGESSNPKEVAEIIRKYVNKFKSTGIDSKSFERAKKAVYGKSMSVFNSVSDIANVLLSFSFSGKGFFEYMDILNSSSLDKLNEHLNTTLDNNYSSLSVVIPK